MSTVVDAMPVGGWRRKYPWEQWFDGRVHLLTQGYDFTATAPSFQRLVYAAARRRGVEVATAVRDAQVYVQRKDVQP